MPKWVPTENQRARAKKLLDDGFGIDKARLCILSKEGDRTSAPICKDTFCKAFKDEIDNAKMDTLEMCIDTVKTKIRDGDLDACKWFIQMHGRGYFNPKVSLDTTKDFANQVNQIIKAAADGVITPMECDSFVNAIKAKIDAQVDECKRRLDALENPENGSN